MEDVKELKKELEGMVTLPPGYRLRIGVEGGPRGDGPRYIGLWKPGSGMLKDEKGENVGVKVLNSRGGERPVKDVADELDAILNSLPQEKATQAEPQYVNIDTDHREEVRIVDTSYNKPQVFINPDGTFTVSGIPSRHMTTVLLAVAKEEKGGFDVRIS